MSSVKKNFIYNVIYQMLIVIVPLITSPYIARVLGVEEIGIYSYTQTIANYFVLFAMLGINNYGNRSIARVRDDKEKLSEEFWNIYGMQLINSLIISVIYIIYCTTIQSEYRIISVLQLLYVISCIFDINWLLFGLEKFKLTITRNIIIKISTVIGIFIFVKNSNQLWVYTIVSSISILISNIITWGFIKKYIKWKKPTLKNILKHYKPLLILFLPVIAISIYKMMDKIMIGQFSSVNQVGFYTSAEKLVNLPNNVIVALGTVMLPRMSYIAKNNDKSVQKKYINSSLLFISILAPAMTFGMLSIAPELIKFFYGENFQDSIILLQGLAFTIIPAAIGTVIRSQFLIPNNRDKLYIMAVIGGACINFIVNIICIPKFGAIGAVVGTVIAEILVTIIQMLGTYKEIDFKEFLINTIYFITIGIFMFIVLRIVAILINNIVYSLFVQIFIGIIYYSIFTLVFLIFKGIITAKEIKRYFNKIIKV